jgi:hypothetical protein
MKLPYYMRQKLAVALVPGLGGLVAVAHVACAQPTVVGGDDTGPLQPVAMPGCFRRWHEAGGSGRDPAIFLRFLRFCLAISSWDCPLHGRRRNLVGEQCAAQPLAIGSLLCGWRPAGRGGHGGPAVAGRRLNLHFQRLG